MGIRSHGAVGFLLVTLAGCSSSSTTAAPSDAGADAGPTSKATGALGAWQTLAPLPTPRANHCAVSANGFLVVIGGNYQPAGKTDFVNIADVHVARIAADGTLGAWSVAGQTPSPVSSCTAASDGADIVLVDGIYDDTTMGGKVRRATLSADGVLGAWQELGPLPTGVDVLYSNAFFQNGTLRAFHAQLPDSGDGISLLSAPLGASSTALGAFQDVSWSKGFRGHPQYALATVSSGASFVYALGGYSSGTNGNAALADGAGAALDAQGVPGASFVVTPLPAPTSFGEAVAVDDWLFLAGGKDGVLTGQGSAAVYAAMASDDGTLGAWTTLAPLPEGRTSLALTVAGDFVYVTGGGFDAGGLATVFGARVRFP